MVAACAGRLEVESCGTFHRGHDAYQAVEQGDVDELTLAGVLLIIQCGDDSAVSVERADVVADGDAALDGVAVGIALHIHKAAHALSDNVKAGTPCICAGLPAGGNGAVNDFGVDLLDGFIVQTEFFHLTGLEGLDDDVCVLYHRLDYLLSVGILHGQLNGLFAAVVPVEVQGLSLQTRNVSAGVVTGNGTLDLDDLGAHVGEHGGAARTCDVVRKVDNANSFQNFLHCNSPFYKNIN